ncbi:T9SS type A sorting domain-containing protein [Lacinutrix jangbogonensis]|uniref:T9SS type A sorting domain-containing protein n=1 Tax=Lacinutrix jangbogonensis TaxID=1469557 RepID=UPI00053DDC77|nr:T9SS type A sorting domain-containing protein [Lacinutrix jangbogonensis]
MKKTTFPFFKSIFALFLLMSATGFAQNVDIILTVDWPQWSTENKVEFYDPAGMLLQTIDNGYDGAGPAANPYNETTVAVSYPVNSSTTAGYYVIVYDFYGDGWNQAGSLTITADGDTAFTFNGSFDTSGTNTPISQTIYFAVEEAPAPPPPFPGVSQFDTSGNNYIEYIRGNMPIIISAPHGGVIQSGETIGGTFYPDNDSALPDRNCGGSDVRDDNTDILIHEIQQSVFDQTGCYPYIIINNLHRSKLDPNRESTEATCSDTDALFYWNAYHDFIDDASNRVMNTYGKGLYIDLHGQNHGIPRIEAGYNILAADLNNTTANYLNTVSNSTITNLVSNNVGGLTQEELVRGPNSLGGIFQDTGGVFYHAQGNSSCGTTSGYRTVPSDYDQGSFDACDDTRPNNNAYFAGDYYSNMRHGSGPAAGDGVGGGGTIDGIMTEVNRRVRDLGTYNGNVYDTRPQTLVPFADDYAIVIKNYIDLHYNDFATFSYTANTYATGGADPTPTKTPSVSSVFTATPAGLSIHEGTGTIDLSTSTAGLYEITHAIGVAGGAGLGTCSVYSLTTMITITNTLSTPDVSEATFAMYPNPTTGKLQIESTQTISKVIVYNLIGQQVKTFNMEADQNSIDISELKIGSYFVNVQSLSGNTYTKLIVKK